MYTLLCSSTFLSGCFIILLSQKLASFSLMKQCKWFLLQSPIELKLFPLMEICRDRNQTCTIRRVQRPSITLCRVRNEMLRNGIVRMEVGTLPVTFHRSLPLIGPTVPCTSPNLTTPFAERASNIQYSIFCWTLL